VTIIAEAVDSLGVRRAADSIEIFLGNIDAPVASIAGQPGVTHRFTPSGPLFGYGCRAERATSSFPERARSWSANEFLRTVSVGTAAAPAGFGAIPVFLNGPLNEKIDIVFFADGTDYNSPNDPAFRQDLFDLIYDGYFTIPYFISFQWIFNFWIATDGTANAGPDPTDSRNLCLRQAPNNFEQRYAFADTSGIVHTSSCRDNAGSPGVFTIMMRASRLQVVAHETGHRPFGLADEYCCDGGYFSSSKPVLSSDYKPPHPNLFKTENKCRDDAVNRPYDADDCRPIPASDGDTWWIGEPNYRALEPNRVDQVRDLMQQTGGTTDLDFIVLDRYDAGDSEVDRLAWWLSKCVQGEC
jgi:hypothetical protein